MEKTIITDKIIQGFHQYYCKTEVIGAENIPSSPFILCSNHYSHLDTTALIYASRLHNSNFAILAAKDYFFESTIIRSRLVNAMFNLIPLPRTQSPCELKRCIKTSLMHLRAGRSLIIYPEGTRNIQKELLPFQRGLSTIALLSGAPILPTYISGTDYALPKNKYLPKPSNIVVKFAKPIHRPLRAGDAIRAKEIKLMLVDKTRRAIENLMGDI